MAHSAKLPKVHALWIGDRLGPLAAACLQSFSKNGHEVILHCYQNLADLPKGIQIQDANKIVPKEEIISHRDSGSFAVFADIFRYELLQQGADLYVDCDVYCLQPIEKADYYFGKETGHNVNSAVLAIPPNSLLLNSLCNLRLTGHERWPWEPKTKFKLKHLTRMLKPNAGKLTLASKRWGDVGPTALTYLAKSFGVYEKATPIDVLYPLHYDSVELLFDPNLQLVDLVTHRTKCIHLYNAIIRYNGFNPMEAPRSSPIGRMLSSEAE